MAVKRKIEEQVLEKIIQALESLEYGTVQITVHDSQITQIEKNEKLRFQLPKQKAISNGKG